MIGCRAGEIGEESATRPQALEKIPSSAAGRNGLRLENQPRKSAAGAITKP
jgi:hypothetical protein